MKTPKAANGRTRGRPKQGWNLRLNNSPISFLLAWAAAAAVLTPSAGAAGVPAATASCARASGQPSSVTGCDTITYRSMGERPSTASKPSASSTGNSLGLTCGEQQRHQRRRSSAFATRLVSPALPLTRGDRPRRAAVNPPLRITAASHPYSLSSLSAIVPPPERPKATMMMLPSARSGAATAAAGSRVGATRMRTIGRWGVPRCAVAENQSSSPQGGATDSTVIVPQQEQRQGGDSTTTLVPRPAGVARDGGKGVAKGGGGDAEETPPDGGGFLWEGLGSWEGLGEGLSGAFLYAQQGFEGLNLLGVGDSFWVNFGQMDVPELPVLPEIHIFGLKWPPPPPPPPRAAAGSATGEKRKKRQISPPPITNPTTATAGVAESTVTTATVAAVGAEKASAGRSGGAGHGGGGDRGAQTWREMWGLPGRLSAWRRERSAAAAAAEAAVTGARGTKSINASSLSSSSSTTAAATASPAVADATAAPAEVAGGRERKDSQRVARGDAAERGAVRAWRWGKLGPLGALRGRPPKHGGELESNKGNAGSGSDPTSEDNGSGEVNRVRGEWVVQKGGKVSRVFGSSSPSSTSVVDPATESGKALPPASLRSMQQQQQQQQRQEQNKKEKDSFGATTIAGSDTSGSSSRAMLSPSLSSPGGAKGTEKGALKDGALKRTDAKDKKLSQKVEKKSKMTKASSPPLLVSTSPSDGLSLSTAAAAAAASTRSAGNAGEQVPQGNGNGNNTDGDSGADGRQAATGAEDAVSSVVDGEGGTAVGGGSGDDGSGRSAAVAGGAGKGADAAPSAPTKFIPKFAPPPNAWKIISSKFPVEEQRQQQDHIPSGKPAVRSTDGGFPPPGWQGDGSASSEGSEGDDADEEEDDNDDDDDFHDFGDVALSVRKIPQPPNMEITINRSSGTPANAETRPVAAAAAKAAADSDNVLEEWVDGEPVEVHHGRTASRRQPRRPADLTATSGEMKLVEMACLTGLSCRAGKSAGRIMGEELGFGHLLRGLREDVRPSLRRRVLQAISTVVDSDPSLAPRLLGLVGDDDTDVAEEKGTGTKKKSTQKKKKSGQVSPAAGAKKQTGARTGGGRKAGRILRRSSSSSSSSSNSNSSSNTATSSTAATGSISSGVAVGAVGGSSSGSSSAGSAWVRLLQGAAERRRRRRVRRRRVAVGGSSSGGVSAASFAGEEKGVASAPFTDGDAILFGEDDLLERITTILGYHGSSGTGFGAGVVPADGGGVEGKTAGSLGPLACAFRAVVDLLRAPRLRPFFVTARDADVAGGNKQRRVEPSAAGDRGAISAFGSGGTTTKVPAGTEGFPKEGAEQSGEDEAAREGRDWWKDEVALEEEGFEQKAAASAGVGQGKEGGSGWVWWWGRGRRVSRERLVEEALELTFRLVMSGDAALEALKVDKKLVAALKRVAEGGGQRLQYDSKGVLRRFGPRLTNSQLLANKCLASLGAHEWRPKMRGQKGVRILCFDGGGTRGVLTVALLKHVEKALGGRQPHEVFDMIVGTSTGGIIAGLAGVKGFPVAECERMYDSLINKIFIKHPGGGVKLALKQAFYDEVGWMKILSSILGDQLMVDSAQDPLRPLIVCPSTLISSNPARVMLWRNYNYPPGHQSRYYGSFRYKVREAIRATTAAPTFFAPLMINGALYSDGALLCNNPSAVAFHEAKHVFPGVPIEMIVSIGTGCFFEEKKEFLEPALGWDGIINQVIASATETEITTDIVSDLLPKEQFFRFNPRMHDMPIDEVRKERLDWLKTLADEYFEMPENQARLQEMAERMLPDSL